MLRVAQLGQSGVTKLPYVKSRADLKKLLCLQYSMLEHAVSLMKPTTQLVYAHLFIVSAG